MNTLSNSEETLRKEVERVMVYVDNEELLAFVSEYRISTNIQEYTRNSSTRNQYEYIASSLKEMQQLKGREGKVRLLLDDFRQTYKRRSAMMRILEEI